MSIHEGHRDRMKERFREHGLDNFSDHNVLELLLLYAIPRRDVNPIAHTLLDTFGTLEGVFEAAFSELVSVPGIGENAATLLSLVPQVSKRHMLAKSQRREEIRDSSDAGSYIAARYLFERDELVYMICLDAMRHVICCKEIARGTVNSAEISLRRIIETALLHSATSVILSHNHTSGVAIPSAEDELTTARVSQALALIGVELIDHIVVAGEDYVSMADSGMLIK